MKHASTRAVFDYWNEKRGARLAPERGDIDPAEIRHALGDTFMLAADFVEAAALPPRRHARLRAVLPRDQGRDFADLWSESKPQVDRRPGRHRHRRGIGAVAGVTGAAEDGADADLELLLLPLAHIGQARIRAWACWRRSFRPIGSAKNRWSNSSSARCAISAPRSDSPLARVCAGGGGNRRAARLCGLQRRPRRPVAATGPANASLRIDQ